jgi:hypothetical protein
MIMMMIKIKIKIIIIIIIIIIDNKKDMYVDRCCLSGDRNVIKKEAEKTLSSKDLTIEIKRIWNVKTKETGATGTISKLFRKYLRSISGENKIKEIEKAAILCAVHSLRKVLIM